MSPLLVALLWAPLSFGLHVGMHEGSHALAGVATGNRVRWFGIADGAAYTFFRDEPNTFTLAAPAVVDALYAPAMALLARSQTGGLRAVLIVEAGMSAGFLATWALGCWTRSAQADGYRTLGSDGRVAMVVPVGVLLGLVLPAAVSTRWL